LIVTYQAIQNRIALVSLQGRYILLIAKIYQNVSPPFLDYLLLYNVSKKYPSANHTNIQKENCHSICVLHFPLDQD
jgi:hypothetical protein